LRSATKPGETQPIAKQASQKRQKSSFRGQVAEEFDVQTWEVNVSVIPTADQSNANFSLRALPGVRGILPRNPKHVKQLSVASPALVFCLCVDVFFKCASCTALTSPGGAK